MSAGRKLVIVESPAKAKTIAGYLGEDYDVEASVGHIRDLPQPSELPADMKKGPFGKFAVDVDNGFEPYYVVDADKKKKVAELKRLLKDADELYLATDEDREGEAIAWHLLEVLKPKVPVKRMVFHEITREAIQRAVNEHPRPRHRAGRRAGDPAHPRPPLRLRGQPGAVAQGPAGPVRRPRAVRRDPHGRRARARADGVRRRRPTGTSRATSRPDDAEPPFTRAADVGRRRRVATGRDFADDGQLTRQRASSTSTRRARPHRWRPAWPTPAFTVASRRSPTPAARPRRSPPRPCSRRPRASCGCPPGRRMRVAQRLYENGYITYMRTDSHDAVATPALDRRAPARPRDLYGAEYVPDTPARATRARSRTRRRRTRRSAPPVTASARPAQVAGSCAATSSRSTS